MRMERTGAGRRAAFTLIEVTLALGVASFSLIAIFGLLPVGLMSNQATIEQTAAGSILSAVSADLRATPPSTSGTTSAEFSIPIPAHPVTSSSTTLYFTSNGQSSNSPTGNPNTTHRLMVSFLPNGSGTNGATLVDLRVTWPAAAAPANAAGSVQTFVALNRN